MRRDDEWRSRPESGPRLFLDSADPEDWRRWLPSGCFHGVTTNPLLLERAGQRCSAENLGRLTGQAADLGARQIHVQTWGADAETMLARSRRLADLGDSGCEVLVKVPATAAGLQVAGSLAATGVGVTLTAVFTPGQALLAAGLGAAYAAPYLGRLDDAGRPGRELIAEMARMLAPTGGRTRLLVASLRSARVVVDLAATGLDTFTFNAEVAGELLASELTGRAAADFERAAQTMGEEP